MKIKLQDYSLISNDFIKALTDYGIPEHFIQTIPAEKLANISWEAAKNQPSGLGIYDEKEEFLNSEIELP